jgi:hypothetical protein
LLLIFGVAVARIVVELPGIYEQLVGGSPGVVIVALPVIQLPPAEQAATAQLPDAEEVIGVEENGQSRAYAVRAMSELRHHVINDQLGGIPITVTYCEQTNCAGVFTDPQAKGPLDVGVGGFDNRPEGGMLLRVGNHRYDQKTGKPLDDGGLPWFPYGPHHFVLVKWKQWRENHPDTDVFVGQSPLHSGRAMP